MGVKPMWTFDRTYEGLKRVHLPRGPHVGHGF